LFVITSENFRSDIRPLSLLCFLYLQSLAGFPFIQEPEIESAPVYYNSIPPAVEQSEPEIVEITEPEPEIQAETDSEKREDDREQRSYCRHSPGMESDTAFGKWCKEQEFEVGQSQLWNYRAAWLEYSGLDHDRQEKLTDLISWRRIAGLNHIQKPRVLERLALFRNAL